MFEGMIYRIKEDFPLQGHKFENFFKKDSFVQLNAAAYPYTCCSACDEDGNSIYTEKGEAVMIEHHFEDTSRPVWSGRIELADSKEEDEVDIVWDSMEKEDFISILDSIDEDALICIDYNEVLENSAIEEGQEVEILMETTTPENIPCKLIAISSNIAKIDVDDITSDAVLDSILNSESEDILTVNFNN